MKHQQTDSFSAYCATRAGLVLGERLTEHQIYEGYVRYCEKTKRKPKSYAELKPRIHLEFWGTVLWWGSIVPHLTDTVILDATEVV